ncbi:MAG: hypothetical protein NC410_08970 [Oscillibacter sp.]|nr:hypothetical protein [Oscillibacter sp.]
MKILEKIGRFIAEKIKLVYDVIDNHKKDTNNPHKVTKSDVGLGNVDNTSDVDKPMSHVVETAIGNISKDLTDLENHVDSEIGNIKNGDTIVAKSEYAQKLGTEQDSFTKQQIEQILNALLSDADLDPETFILTFTYRNGTQKTFDLPIEATVKDGRYDDETKELVLVLVSDQEIRIPASGLIKVYIGGESTTTTVSINERTGEITVDVKEGAITKEHLTTELQTEIAKLENLPENANGTFATKEELEQSGIKIVPINFINTTLQERRKQVVNSLSDITTVDELQEKPLYALVDFLSDTTERKLLIPLVLETAYTDSYSYSADILDKGLMCKKLAEDEASVLYPNGLKIVISLTKSISNPNSISNFLYMENDFVPETKVNVFKLDFNKEYAPTDTPMDEVVTFEIIKSLGGISFEDLASQPSYFFVKCGGMDILAPLKIDFTYKSSRAIKYKATLNTNIDIWGSTTTGEDNSLYVENAEIVVIYNKVAGSFNVLFDTASTSSTKVFNMSLQAMKTLNFDETYSLRLGTTASINWAKSEKCDTWDDLSKYIQDNNVSILPLINLKTPTSKYLYPAAVDFLMPSGLSRDVYSISIRYIGEVDGKEKLITETLDFTNRSGETGLSKCLGANYCNYIKTAQDIVYPPSIINASVGEDKTITINTEDLESYYQKVMKGMPMDNVRLTLQNMYPLTPIAMVQENGIHLEVGMWTPSGVYDSTTHSFKSASASMYSITCQKVNDVWNVEVDYFQDHFEPKKYMNVENIHVLTAYPTDLSSYPDGSIFIKTE